MNASRYLTVSLYDDIADPANLGVVFAIEALTNPRIRDQLGQLEPVPPRGAGQRRRQHADHGRVHPPEPRGLALFRRQLQRVLRRP